MKIPTKNFGLNLKDKFSEKIPEKLKSLILALKGEEIVSVRRQHWVVLLPQALLTLGLVIFFLILLIFSLTFGLFSFILLLVSFLLVVVVLIAYGYKSYQDWKDYLYVVTNKKIAVVNLAGSDIEWEREVITDSAKETSIEVKVPLPGRYLGYGDVTVTFETSSRVEPITFEKVPNPNGFRKALEEAGQS
jgi:membrane protein implicated in regulation of membrane protease activity